jgi:hypothetical protein
LWLPFGDDFLPTIYDSHPLNVHWRSTKQTLNTTIYDSTGDGLLYFFCTFLRSPQNHHRFRTVFGRCASAKAMNDDVRQDEAKGNWHFHMFSLRWEQHGMGISIYFYGFWGSALNGPHLVMRRG